jgi:hypothetical protein
MSEGPQKQRPVKAVAVRWRDSETVPIHTANQFLVQVDTAGDHPEQAVLAIGQVTPPPIVGTPEEQHAQLEQINEVDVITVARYSITPGRLRELIGLLQQVQRAFETREASETEAMRA